MYVNQNLKFVEEGDKPSSNQLEENTITMDESLIYSDETDDE